MRVFIAIYRIYAILIGLVLVRGLDPSSSSSKLRICTTEDCPNQHVEVVDDVAGTIHRYSKNAANFHEAKSQPHTADVTGSDRATRLAPARSVTDPKLPNARGQSESESELDARAKKNGSLRQGNVHTGVNVSVLGDGQTIRQQQDIDQKTHPQHQQQPLHSQPQLHHRPQEQSQPQLLHRPQEQSQPQLHHQPQEQYHPQQRHQPDEHRPQGENHGHNNQMHQSISPHQKPAEASNAPSEAVRQPTPDAEPKPLTQAARGQPVEEGIYWSAMVEGAIPPGLSATEVDTWTGRIRRLQVTKVEDASLHKCGSNLNKHVVFEDGTTSCARYRHPMVQFVLGDLYCYYLARILGMQNVPTVVLSWVSSRPSTQWSLVAEDIFNAQWINDTVCSFSLWIENIGSSDLPELLYDNQHNTVHQMTPGFADLNLTQMVELAQYSDLMIFDYITCHLDRMTIRKNAVEYYGEDWLYRGEVHNLAKHKTNGGLWFIDNENGLFNAYSVAYAAKHKEQMQKYHEELLRSLCIFRRSTVKMVQALSGVEDPFQVLNATVFANEPVMDHLREQGRQWMPPKLKERFKQRLMNVANWIKECKLRYSD